MDDEQDWLKRLVEGSSYRGIQRDTGHDRRTVKKRVRAYVKELVELKTALKNVLK